MVPPFFIALCRASTYVFIFPGDLPYKSGKRNMWCPLTIISKRKY